MLTASTKRTVLSSPLLLMALSFTTGAILGWKQCGTSIAPLWYFIMALMLVILTGISYVKKHGAVPYLLVLFCLLTGYARGRSSSEEVDVVWPSKPQIIAGTIINHPSLNGENLSFQLQCNSLQDKHGLLKDAKIRVYVKDTVTMHRSKMPYAPGDNILFKATMKAPANRGNPDEFDYAAWMRVQGVSGICWTELSQLQKMTSQDGYSAHWTTRLKTVFLKVRTRIASLLSATGFEGDTLALVSALTLGDRSLLTQETKTRFADAGASHLLALSGLHLSILIGLFLPLFQGRLLLSRWRWPLAVALFAFIWCYALLAGLPTSLVRACTMTSIFLLGSLMNRQGKPLNHLLLAAIIMVIVNPAYVFDIGAQLSFCAVLGIICYQHFNVRYQQVIAPRFRSAVYRRIHQVAFPPLSIFFVSLAAQIFTLPIVALTFHQIPLYAPVFNILFIPITTILIYYIAAFLLVLALTVSLFSIEMPVSSTMQHIVTWIPNTLVTAETAIMNFENGLPGGVIEDFWSSKATPQLVIYNNPKAPALHLILSPEESYLLPGKASMPTHGMDYIASTFWKCRLTETPKTVDASLLYHIAETRHVKEIDHLLWVHSPKEDGQNINDATKLIVLDACLSYRDRAYWQRIAAEHQIPFYDGRKGAFCCKITLER